MIDFLNRGVSTAFAFTVIFVVATFGFGGACWYKLTELEQAKQIAEKDMPMVPLIVFAAKTVNVSTSLSTSTEIFKNNPEQLKP